MNRNYVLVLTLVVVLLLARAVSSAIFITDNTGVTVPADNGTSTMLNITARMQQYIGFFGQVNTTVKINTTAGAPKLYDMPVTSGKIFFLKNGDVPSGAIVPALNDSETDGNFSLTGYYVTGNHFVKNDTVCGIASVDHLLTTDGYKVGIFKDSGETPVYFVGTDIAQVTSSNGMGTPVFEVIAPKTSVYDSYDVYIDLE